MYLKTFVKVGNISNLSDARYCAGCGVNMLGFNFDPKQPDAMSIEKVKEIMGWVAVENFVLECGSITQHEIETIHQEFPKAYIQVDDVQDAHSLTDKDLNVILKVNISTQKDIHTLNELLQKSDWKIEYLLVECDKSEFYSMINDIVGKSDTSLKILNGFNSNPNSVLNIVAQNIYHGIALKGSAEEKAGFKDYDELADILEILEKDD